MDRQGRTRRKGGRGRLRVAVVAMVTSEQFADLTNDDRRVFHRLQAPPLGDLDLESGDEAARKGRARDSGKGTAKEKETEKESRVGKDGVQGGREDEVDLVPVVVVWDRKDGKKDAEDEEEDDDVKGINFFQELEQKVRSVYEDGRHRASASEMELDMQVLVVTRTPWDYTQRYPRWQRFLRHARSFANLAFAPPSSHSDTLSSCYSSISTESPTPSDAQTRVECPVHFFNDIPTLEWNGHKQYLIDLSRSSDPIPVVPTRLIRKGSDLSPAIAQIRKQNTWHMHAEFVIIKPAVGSFGNDVNLVKLGSGASSKQDTKILKHLEVLASQQDMLIQPFLASVKTRGEVSLIFIDGAFVHAIKKKPSAGDFKVQGGKVDKHEPTDEELDLGIRTLQACMRIDSVHCEWDSTDDSWLETATEEGEAAVTAEGDDQTGSSQARKAKANDGGGKGAALKKTKQQSKQPTGEEVRTERKAKASGSNKNRMKSNTPKKKDASVQASYLYARVDLLSTNRGKLMVSEVELLDPELFFRFSPECVEAFRRALLHRAS
jgi:hypothetical protein